MIYTSSLPLFAQAQKRPPLNPSIGVFLSFALFDMTLCEHRKNQRKAMLNIFIIKVVQKGEYKYT